ncbi:hypothetical protein CYG49_03255 [Candidatus Saccharibacteria bacterium]|nr:MAG: hypothetical protein CYG49_03255 [Candidatus Saccharibacteria bacterium]
MENQAQSYQNQSPRVDFIDPRRAEAKLMAGLLLRKLLVVQPSLSIEVTQSVAKPTAPPNMETTEITKRANVEDLQSVEQPVPSEPQAQIEEYEILWQRYGKLIEHIARGISAPPQLYEDLVQEGMIALWKTAPKFDPAKGQSLTAFVYPRIRGAMLDYLRERDVLSRGDRDKFKKITALLADGMSDTEVCKQLGISHQKLGTLLVTGRGEVSIDAENGAEVRIIDLISDPHNDYQQIDEEVSGVSRQTGQLVALIEERIDLLGPTLITPRNKAIFLAYCRGNITLARLGEEHNVTESRVAQIVATIAKRLKPHIIDQFEELLKDAA